MYVTICRSFCFSDNVGREMLKKTLAVAFTDGNVLAVVGHYAVARYAVDMVCVYYV